MAEEGHNDIYGDHHDFNYEAYFPVTVGPYSWGNLTHEAQNSYLSNQGHPSPSTPGEYAPMPCSSFPTPPSSATDMLYTTPLDLNTERQGPESISGETSPAQILSGSYRENTDRHEVMCSINGYLRFSMFSGQSYKDNELEDFIVGEQRHLRDKRYLDIPSTCLPTSTASLHADGMVQHNLYSVANNREYLNNRVLPRLQRQHSDDNRATKPSNTGAHVLKLGLEESLEESLPSEEASQPQSRIKGGAVMSTKRKTGKRDLHAPRSFHKLAGFDKTLNSHYRFDCFPDCSSHRYGIRGIKRWGNYLQHLRNSHGQQIERQRRRKVSSI